MPARRTYATAEAFRRALEERLKRAALTDQVDLIRLRMAEECGLPTNVATVFADVQAFVEEVLTLRTHQ